MIEKEIPGLYAESFIPQFELEASKVWELYQAAIMLEVYFHLDQSEAILLLKCADIEEAHDKLESLNVVCSGLITSDVIPLKPYSGCSRLFDKHRVS